MNRSEKKELFAAALSLLGPQSDAPKPDFWDTDLNVHFRPGKFLGREDATEAACRALISMHRTNLDVERRLASVTPSGIRKKLERWRNGLLKLASEMERTTQVEYRLILAAAPEPGSEFVQSLIPVEWPDIDGATPLSKELRARVVSFDSLLKPIRGKQWNTAWSQGKKGGRGRNLLRDLEMAPARWHLVHMAWRVYHEFGYPLNSPKERKNFGTYVTYMHELAGGRRDVSFDGEIKRHRWLSSELLGLSRDLRIHSTRLGLSTFQELELYAQNLMATAARSGSRIAILKTKVDRYLAIRRQLVSGPIPLPRRSNKPR